MFLVFYEVIHPVTRLPLLTVGQKITGTALMAMSKEFGFDMPKHLLKLGVIQYIANP
jgi:hypothetical protein